MPTDPALPAAGPVAVIGAGSWGTTVASLSADNGIPTRLWARNAEVAAKVNDEHRSPYLPGVSLPWGLRATTDLVEAVDGASLVVMGVPSHAFRSIAGQLESLVADDAVFLSLAKGVEQGSLKRMTEVLDECLSAVEPARIGVLSGPNLAIEIARRQPAATVVAFPDEDVAEGVQRLFHSTTFRVYRSTDVTGVEMGGALKNVVALAAGMCAGIGFGDNALAAVITRGLAEMTRLGVQLGGRPMTFSGLSGMGDLLATCTSLHSRNRHVGEELGKGRRIDEIIEEMNMVAEGVKSTRAICDLAASVGIDMPIAEQVAAVLYDGRNAVETAMELLGRPASTEFAGIEQSS